MGDIGLKIKEWASFDRFVHANILVFLLLIAVALWKNTEAIDSLSGTLLEVEREQGRQAAEIEIHEGIFGHEGTVRLATELQEQVAELSEVTAQNFTIIRRQISSNSLISERRDTRDILITADLSPDQVQRYNDRLHDIELELESLRSNRNGLF